MSLPAPTVGGSVGAHFPPSGMNPADLAKMDAPLIALANQSGGDLRQLLFMFFSFLHRRTDFYVIHHEDDVRDGVPVKMGFKEGDAEKMLLAAFRQFPLRKMPRQGGKTATSTSKTEAKTQAAAEESTRPKVGKQKEDKVGKETMKEEVAAAGGRSDCAQQKQKSSDAVDSVEKGISKVRVTEEGKQVPVGNGGSTSRYQWTQTIDEVTVAAGLPEGTKGKDLDIIIKPSLLSVMMKRPVKDGEEPPTILEGKLTEKIRKDESTWSLEGGVLLITLEKVVKTWWRTVLEGDEEIDTDMIDSTRNISTYDEATQGMIRKCIFDQRQERMGLASSDEILGRKPVLPTLPPGVEYIDKKTLDDADGTG
mmetsp:Transcript_34096/g.74750  ORF Transcript_34096/g.74750 Transcript_34096/m.74750 type:complete len:365 (-) Transcript_34096:80-1174(-)